MPVPKEYRRHRLRQMLRRFRGRLGRRRLRHLTVLAVTGSCGKTTTTDLLSRIISTRADCFSGICDNGENSIIRNIRKITQRHSFWVQEVSGHRPGFLKSVLSVLQPQIGIVISVGQDHYKSFRSLEATALEKGMMVELLPEDGVAVLNADDPYVAAMAKRTNARLITYGRNEEATLRASDVRSAWPERLSMTVTYEGASVHIQTELFGDLLLPSVLAAVGGALAVGFTLRECAESLNGLCALPGRQSVHQTKQGAWFISDTWKAPLWTAPKVLRQLETAVAPRKTIVFGSFSDVPSSDSHKSRAIAREALKIADRVFFVGRKAFYIRKMLSPELEGRLYMIDSPEEAARILSEDVIMDELVMIKSGNREHLERLICAQDTQLNCWKADCKKLNDCRICEESGLTGCESNDPS